MVLVVAAATENTINADSVYQSLLLCGMKLSLLLLLLSLVVVVVVLLLRWL